MAIDAGALIRAGSGFAFATVGMLTWWATRRSPDPAGRALAGGIVALGIGFIAVNVDNEATADAFAFVQAAGFAAFTAALAFILLHWARAGSGRDVRLALGGALVIGPVLGISIHTIIDLFGDATEVTFTTGFRAALTTGMVMIAFAAASALIAGRRAARSSDTREQKALALFAWGVTAWPAFVLGSLTAGPSLVFTIAGWAAMLPALVTWLRVARVGRGVTWGLLLTGLVAMIEVVLVGQEGTGLVGIVRIVAAVALALAVLRHGLFGASVNVSGARRGTLATGALAALFIVAQVAQNFLSDGYGLLMGGVVAGALLFAAAPLQRAVERMNAVEGVRASPEGAAPSRARSDENLRVYKVALRRFLADGNVSAEEEIALAHLADELGLTTRATTELRHEVERELGRRA